MVKDRQQYKQVLLRDVFGFKGLYSSCWWAGVVTTLLYPCPSMCLSHDGRTPLFRHKHVDPPVIISSSAVSLACLPTNLFTTVGSYYQAPLQGVYRAARRCLYYDRAGMSQL